MSDTPAVKSATRTLALLDLLARFPGGVTFSEILVETGWPKGSLHGLLATLKASGWIRLQPETKLYSLGFRAWQVGAAYASAAKWETRAVETMTRLRDRFGETIQLAVLDGMQALYVAKVDGLHPLRLDSRVGQRLEAHATGVGKLLLASLPRDRVAVWLADRRLERYTGHTIVDPTALLAELDRIRATGHAYDDEERTVGASCIAVGVADDAGAVVGALSISVPSIRFDAERRREALPLLRDAACELSATIGSELRSFAP
jgi:DNA-binding IclR family transcriptional regulator